MKYALLIYADQTSWVGLSDEEKARLRAEEMPRWISLMEDLAEADPAAKGYELDEAIRLASLVPTAWHGSLEIRPIVQ